MFLCRRPSYTGSHTLSVITSVLVSGTGIILPYLLPWLYWCFFFLGLDFGVLVSSLRCFHFLWLCGDISLVLSFCGCECVFSCKKSFCRSYLRSAFLYCISCPPLEFINICLSAPSTANPASMAHRCCMSVARAVFVPVCMTMSFQMCGVNFVLD